jgi:hypothetical protein
VSGRDQRLKFNAHGIKASVALPDGRNLEHCFSSVVAYEAWAASGYIDSIGRASPSLRSL